MHSGEIYLIHWWINFAANFQLHHNSEEDGSELKTEQACWEGFHSKSCQKYPQQIFPKWCVTLNWDKSFTFLHCVLTGKTLLRNMYNVQPAWTPRVRLSHQGDSALRSDRTPLDLCSLASWSSRQSRGSRTCDGGLLGIAQSACLLSAVRRWCTSAGGYSVSLQPLRWWCYHIKYCTNYCWRRWWEKA